MKVSDASMCAGADLHHGGSWWNAKHEWVQEKLKWWVMVEQEKHKHKFLVEQEKCQLVSSATLCLHRPVTHQLLLIPLNQPFFQTHSGSSAAHLSPSFPSFPLVPSFPPLLALAWSWSWSWPWPGLSSPSNHSPGPLIVMTDDRVANSNHRQFLSTVVSTS